MITETIETDHGPLQLTVTSDRHIAVRSLGNVNANGDRGTFGPFWGVRYSVAADLYLREDGSFQIGDPSNPAHTWLKDDLLMSRVTTPIDSRYGQQASASVKTKVAKIIETMVALWLHQHPDAQRTGELAAVDRQIAGLD